MQQITVRVLYELVKKEILKGNGDKKIIVADDIEGNGYHGMYFGFVSSFEGVKECIEFSNGVYETDTENPKELIILG